MSATDDGGPPQWVYLDGRMVERDAARISPFDRGFLYGDGFFETTRILGGRPLLLERHLDRLASSCRQTGFGDAFGTGELKAGIRWLIEANGVEDGYLRITVSRGLHGGRLDELGTDAPTVFTEARPMILPPIDAPPPFVLARSRYRRNERSPAVRHKSLSYQGNLLALAEGRQRGADEVFFLNSQGHLTEGAITNLFFVADGVVCTPHVDCGLLPGVTRQVVLEICAQGGLPTDVGAYEEGALRGADEVFCTNSLRGVAAVEKILDYPDHALGVHDLTIRIRRAYADLCQQT